MTYRYAREHFRLGWKKSDLRYRPLEIDNYEHILFDQEHEESVDNTIYAKRLAEKYMERNRRHQ